ncbi:MAG: hypothetical protein QM723_34630 [Myxococcaceae bacterium]
MAWKPALRSGVKLETLPLSPLLGYVASRLDGQSDLDSLAKVTGMPLERVQGLVAELVTLGAVDGEAGSAPVTKVTEASPAPAVEPAPEAGEAAAQPPPAEEQADEPIEGEQDSPETQQTHRQLFENTLKPLDKNERVAMAPKVEDPQLSALCFDPLPEVILALLGNSRFGPAHARLVARHHHHSAGLDKLTANSAFAADLGVRRALLQNPQLSAALYRRLWQNKRLLDQFKVATSREVTELTRRNARDVMRSRWTAAQPDERVELIIKTEGRCLQMLIGLPVDGKTSAMLCGRSYASTTLVQNLARWSPAPPALIAHLLKQDLVRRSPTLRTLLQRHPNAPSHKE